MRKATLTLGGEGFEIEELPRPKNQAWRELYRSKVAELATAATEKQDEDAGKPTPDDTVDYINGLMASRLDLADEMVRAYAPALPWAEIDGRLAESEIVAAFEAVAGLGFPSGALSAPLKIPNLG